MSTFKDLSALSANSLLILYSHDNQGIPYSYALLPTMINADNTEHTRDIQHQFISGYTRYMSYGEEEWLSKHFLDKKILDFFQDFAVIFRVVETTNYGVYFGHFVGNRPHIIVIDFPKIFADDIQQAFLNLPYSESDDTIRAMWNEWEDCGLCATYLSLKQLPRPKQQDKIAYEELQYKIQSHTEKLANKFNTAFKNIFYYSQHDKMDDVCKPLTNGVKCLLRLFAFQWTPAPSWSTVVYSVSSVAADDLGNRATSLLAFISEEDAICHNFIGSTITPGDRNYAGNFMEMRSALNLFLSEVELVHYSINHGISTNYENLQNVWGHEVAKVYVPCKTLLKSHNFDPLSLEIVNIGLQSACLWTAAESLYENSFGLWQDDKGERGNECKVYFEKIFSTAWENYLVIAIRGGIDRLRKDGGRRWSDLSGLLKKVPLVFQFEGSFLFAPFPQYANFGSKAVSMLYSQLMMAICTNAFLHALYRLKKIASEKIIDMLSSDFIKDVFLKITVKPSNTGHVVEILNTFSATDSIKTLNDDFWEFGTPLSINMVGMQLYKSLNVNYNREDFVEFLMEDKVYRGFVLNIPLRVIDAQPEKEV